MKSRPPSVTRKALQQALQLLLAPHEHNSREEWLIASMRSLKILFDADKSAVRLRTAQGLIMISEDHEAGTLDAYVRYYHRFDCGNAVRGFRGREQQIWTIEKEYGPRLGDFYQSEYFNDFLDPYRMYHCLAVASEGKPSQSKAVLYFHRDKASAPAFGLEGKQLMQLIAPAWRAAITISGLTGPGYSPFLDVVDELQDACALYTPAGLLLHRNPAMSDMLVTLHDGGRMARCIHTTVQDIIGIAGKRRNGSEVAAGVGSREVMSGGTTYLVAGCILGYFHDVSEPAVMVTVRKEDIQLPTCGNMRDRFNLSDRESEVARLLASRMTTREIAQRLVLSEHTVRHHTERVLEKLRVDGRREVAAALSAKSGGDYRNDSGNR